MSNIERLKEIAKNTPNKEFKEAINKRIELIKQNQDVKK